jgi:mono/diheme cytochrome c family protein
VLALGGALACSGPPERPQPKQLVHAEQGWSERDRAIYYYTPQGTELHGLRYAWFRALEMPSGRDRLADPRMLARFGFLYDPEALAPGYTPPPYNPANLPVGFTSHVDAGSGEAMLGITCAACHTGQLEYRGTAIRIDGGQALHAIASTTPGSFTATLLLSLQTTYANPFKFDRFARRVLGVRYPGAKPELREALGATLDAFAIEGYRTIAKGLYPTEGGPGRIDALDHIANTVFGDDLDPDNYRIGNAPVSYPHVWDIWKFDWVQWNGSVAQPMARNVGEALGVKARLALVDRTGNALPPEQMYDSSVLVPELHCIETTLRKLGPPLWNEAILPPIDRAKAARGRGLFETNCYHCHGPIVYSKDEPRPTPAKPIEWRMTLVPTTEIGTDPYVANNFLDYRYDASALMPGNPALKLIDSGNALSLVTANVIERKYAALGIYGAERAEYDGFGRGIGVNPQRVYKSRPLHGIWATPPFLHNGSVPNVYEMLLPEERRSRSFWVGDREYDPVRLGYRNREVPGAFLLDTTIPGNANSGHQFRDDGGVGVIGRALSDDERFEILEYLKVLGNPRYGYAEPTVSLAPPRCGDGLQGPAAFP